MKSGTAAFRNRIPCDQGEKKLFIDKLLVRIYLIIEMILVDEPCAMGV